MAYPATYNISYYMGDTYDFNVYPKQADGSAFDLTGYSVNFKIASSVGPSPTFSVNAGSQGAIIRSGNYIECKILPEVGNQLTNTNGQYYYDIEISNGVSKVYTVLKGTISVTPDVRGA